MNNPLARARHSSASAHIGKEGELILNCSVDPPNDGYGVPRTVMRDPCINSLEVGKRRFPDNDIHAPSLRRRARNSVIDNVFGFGSAKRRSTSATCSSDSEMPRPPDA